MKAVQIQDDFGLEHLTWVERAILPPNDRQVRVRIRAASINYRDLLMIRGQYNRRQPLPLVPLSDASGEVVEVGTNVTRFVVGDRVALCFCPRWTDGDVPRDVAVLRDTLGGPRQGVLQEEMNIDEDAAVLAPEHLSHAEVSTLPCAALTAWSALFTGGEPVQPGQTVLIQGTGGVALFALAFAQMTGARPIVLSGSDEKRARIEQEFGVRDSLNYRVHPEWGRWVRDRTGDGVDHVLELGGQETLGQSLQAVRPGGAVHLIGVLSGANPVVDLLPIVMRGLRLRGVFVGHRGSFEDMNRAIALHGFRPTIDRVFPLAQAVDAIQAFASARHFGKIVIDFGGADPGTVD
jgi:NADPH:quinone reductase-like Zn-dependent oxidoreductase